MSNSRTFRTDAALDEAARFYGDEGAPGIVDRALGNLDAPEPTKWIYRCRTHGKEWSGMLRGRIPGSWKTTCRCCGARASTCRKCDVAHVAAEVERITKPGEGPE